ncbi:nucleotide exchange factor GrpE [Roseivivax sp. CAU 1761]
MADPKNDDFLDDVETAEAELYGTEAEDEEAGAPEATARFSDEIEALRAERDELRDRFMRALADAENARKRADRERRDAESYGGTRLARDLLPVYDNLHRALAAAGEERPETTAALIEGVELTLRELRNVFQKHGITEIAPEPGEKFDPKLHEAMFEAPVPDTRAGDIIQVSAVGFLLHDRLLRPAQVGVSSTPAG